MAAVFAVEFFCGVLPQICVLILGTRRCAFTPKCLNLSRFGALAGLRRARRGEYARGIAARVTAELHMKRLCFIATAVATISLTAGVALAQTAPAGGAAPGAAAGAAAAPAATAAPAAAPAATAPAATAPAAEKPAAATDKPAEPKKEAAEPKKKKTAQKKESRQQEIDRSIDRGTVPSRYRTQVPKQYHHLIPFDR
jgi:hypothetical protein